MKKDNVRVITSKPSFLTYWKEVMDYRELFWILAKRDIMVRYKQTIFGILWSIVKPLFSALAYAFLGVIGKISSGLDLPILLVIWPGAVLWLFFSQSLQTIGLSIVTNNNLVSKVFFPRIIIPFSSFFLGLIEVAISMVIFFGLCLYFGFTPDYKLIFAPLFIFLAYLAAAGVGLFAAVLNVKYRDVGQLIPFVMQFGMFVSPVVYTTEVVKINQPHLYPLFVLNPVTGCIDSLRWALLGGQTSFNWESFIPLLIFCFVSIILAIRFFRRHESSFVDYI